MKKKVMKKKEGFVGLQKQKTMKLSVKEASVASVTTGISDSYITPYALALNANNLHITFLSSFIGIIPPFSQLFGSRLIEKYSRNKVLFFFVFLQALMWLPILLLSFLFWKNIFVLYLPWILIIFYSIYAIFGAVGSPAWFSLLGDILPENQRGRYFAMRNRGLQEGLLCSQ